MSTLWRDASQINTRSWITSQRYISCLFCLLPFGFGLFIDTKPCQTDREGRGWEWTVNTERRVFLPSFVGWVKMRRSWRRGQAVSVSVWWLPVDITWGVGNDLWRLSFFPSFLSLSSHLSQLSSMRCFPSHRGWILDTPNERTRTWGAQHCSLCLPYVSFQSGFSSSNLPSSGWHYFHV